MGPCEIRRWAMVGAAVALSFAAATLAAAAAVPARATTWMTRVGGLQPGWGQGGVVQNADGSYFLYGTSPTDFRPTLARLDSGGSPAWVRSFSPGDFVARGIDRAPGGDLVISAVNAGGSSIVARVGAGGDLLWQKQSDLPFGHVLVDGTSCYLATRRWQDAQGRPGIALTKVDLATSSVVWSQAVTFADSFRTEVLRLDRDGGLLLAGMLLPAEAPPSGLLLKVPAGGGKPSFSKRLSGAIIQNIHDIVGLAGGYAFAGIVNLGGGAEDDVWVGKVYEGKPWGFRWQKALGGCSIDWAYRMVPMTDGSLQVGAATQSGTNNGDYDMWGINLSASDTWRVNWSRRYWTVDRDEGYGLTATSDGGMLLIGAYSSALVGTLLAKTDADGNVDTALGSGCSGTIPCAAVADHRATETDTAAVIAEYAASSEPLSFPLAAPEPALESTLIDVRVDTVCH